MLDSIGTVDVVFLVLAVITVLSAIVALEAKELVYGAMALTTSFLGVAGFFVLLEASFLAMLHILVFIGAVAILILFTVMLVKRDVWKTADSGPQKFVGIITAALLIVGISFIGMISGLASRFPNPTMNFSFVNIGEQLLIQYWPALQILAVVLSAAVIGGLTMAKLERDDSR